ncbi:DUF4326 domain-containing protein [Vibrio fluvialis]|nr:MULTISPECIES: DUF4326 domain-containing protein [Vibrio]MCU8331829.1 DUF4326 domain-containing protein [Vibrio vulnificus]MCU8357501.1 DUF4326 domain-containing protein [Vibrio vulnificus]WMN55859.1 DUF4326 domain-containing protein [Vibrio fluvialis]
MSKILSNLDTPTLAVVNDVNALGSSYAEEFKLCYEALELPLPSSLEDFSHAIVFSDGEEFIEEVMQLRGSAVKTKVQKVSITRVVNINKDPIYNNKANTDKFEYIGRGSPWGNPYPIGVDGDDRCEVLRKYKYDFDHNNFLNITKEDMLRLSGKRLGCFCKPFDCHGDIIADYLNSYDDGS